MSLRRTITNQVSVQAPLPVKISDGFCSTLESAIEQWRRFVLFLPLRHHAQLFNVRQFVNRGSRVTDAHCFFLGI